MAEDNKNNDEYMNAILDGKYIMCCGRACEEVFIDKERRCDFINRMQKHRCYPITRVYKI